MGAKEDSSGVGAGLMMMAAEGTGETDEYCHDELRNVFFCWGEEMIFERLLPGG